MPIDGLVSGLDTNSIITQLMDIERKPRTLMATRRDSAQAAVDAFKAIETKLATVTSAAADLQRANGWNLRTATTSAPDVATASVSTGATQGAFSFTVDSLARAHGVATAIDVPLATSVIASSGSITIHQQDGDHVLSVGGGSIGEVAAAINRANLGIRAATVNTGSGLRLQVSAVASGVKAQFDITAGIDGGIGTVMTTQGTDAAITLGSGAGAYQIHSASNTFTDLVPGVAVTVRALSATPVQLDISTDVTALGDKVQAMIDAVNGAVGLIASSTAYDPTTKKAAVLVGDSAARKVAQALTRAVTEAVQQSALHSAGLAGVSVDRYGKMSFDRSKFENAYQTDPVAVQRLFVQGATTTGSVEFIGASDATLTATGTVSVSTLSSAATSLGLTGAWPQVPSPTLRVRIGDVEASYTVTDGESAADVRAGFQAAIEAKGLPLDVTESGGGLRITHRNIGTAAAFDVAWDGTTFASNTGTDVSGTIDGVASIGSGDLLTSPSTAQNLPGLTVRVSGTTIGDVGTVSYEPGLAQRLAQAIAQATNSTGGYLSGAEDTQTKSIATLTTAIDAYDLRLTAREAALRKQYSDLEVTLGNLKNQSNYLASQLSSLPSTSSSSSG